MAFDLRSAKKQIDEKKKVVEEQKLIQTDDPRVIKEKNTVLKLKKNETKFSDETLEQEEDQIQPSSNINLAKSKEKQEELRPGSILPSAPSKVEKSYTIKKAKHKLSLSQMIDVELPDVVPLKVEDIRKQQVVVIEGGKSSSKTATAMSFLGKKLVIGFEQKAAVIWEEMFEATENIEIHDCSRFIKDFDELSYLETSAMAISFAQKVLAQNQERNDIDWVIIDGVDWMAKYSEYAMRYQFDFGLTQNFDWQFWNWRNMYFEGIQSQALNIGKKGIIFTLYPFVPSLNEKKDKETGDVISSEWTKAPKWRVDLLKDVDNIIKVWSELPKDTAFPNFFLQTVSMKRGFVNGVKIDITSQFDSVTKKIKPSRAYELLYEQASYENYKAE